MNKFYLIFGTGVISLSIVFVCLWLRNNKNGISVSITDAENTYTLSAYYPKNQTESVTHYLNECLKPSHIFRHSDELDEEITLSDRTRFHIKTSEGRLYLKLDKSLNSRKSILRMKTICKGIRFNGS